MGAKIENLSERMEKVEARLSRLEEKESKSQLSEGEPHAGYKAFQSGNNSLI